MQYEHAVYGADIPEDDDEVADHMEHDLYEEQSNYDSITRQDAATLEEMKKRLRDIEAETAAIKEMQAKVERDMGINGSNDGTFAPTTDADSRSVFVGNVDYSCTSEDLRIHFQLCGTINRITIKSDKFGKPKGFAYIEFLETEAVHSAFSLNDSELHGRKIKVIHKRKNLPGMKRWRARPFNAYAGLYSRRPRLTSFNPASYGRPGPGYGVYGYGFGKIPSVIRSYRRFNPYDYRSV